MDEGKGRKHGETTDPDDQSNGKKVTPAVADEDYNEHYGNMDIGPGFLQPLPMNKASGVKNKEVERKNPPPSPPPPRPRPFLSVQNAGGVSLPGTSGTGQKQPIDFVRGGNSLFFLGGLHWWTTDADLEYELCKYGKVRDLRIFLHEDCGKSKGYCQVEFYDPLAAAVCKKGLVGHKFNGRPCIVSSSRTPFLGTNQPDVDNGGKKEPNEVEATINQGGDGDNQGKKGPDEVEATKPGDGIKKGGDGVNRGYGRCNWGRGNNLGVGNRGYGNPVWIRGGGTGGSMGRMGGAAPRMLPRPRMGAMSKMGGYAGFPGGPIPLFPGIFPSQPGVGLRGLAPYGNYSFYGRGIPRHGTGMIPPSGIGMQPVPDTGRLGGDQHGGGKVAGASYGEEAASDHRYDEVNRDRGDLPNARREKDRVSEMDLPGTSERTFKDDRVPEFDRYVPSENDPEYDHEEIGNLDDTEISRARSQDSDIDRERARSLDHVPDREDRGRYPDHHRFKDDAPQNNDERERGQLSRASIKSRLSYPTRKYSHNGKRR
ncbi:unnamed protein product [Vicia faba]|uniref:RRM domain-containing protein n=1 Tax=Vicia faba TaxID=3906 RepID=A0AAV0ZGR0_VICFA|nr:unnamed protein product [Vicia faba]